MFVKVDHGLALVPGTNIDKLVENFEGHFGPVRIQQVACDGSIQLPDVSAGLVSHGATHIGLQWVACYTWQEIAQISYFQ